MLRKDVTVTSRRSYRYAKKGWGRDSHVKLKVQELSSAKEQTTGRDVRRGRGRDVYIKTRLQQYKT